MAFSEDLLLVFQNITSKVTGAGFAVAWATLFAVSSCSGSNLQNNLGTKKNDDDSGNHNDGTDTEAFQPTGLNIVPASAIIMRGESTQLQSQLTSDDGGVLAANGSTVWVSGDEAKATVDAAGVVTGKAAGKVQISGDASGFNAKTEIEVLKCQISEKQAKTATAVKVDADSWPPQGREADPPTYDDYSFEFVGDFLVDGYQVFAVGEQEAEFKWNITPEANLLTKIQLRVVDCDNNPVKTFEFNPSTTPVGSHKLAAGRGGRISIFSWAQESITSRTYDLLYEKEAAFKITLKTPSAP